MKNQKLFLRKFTALLCVILILACLSVLFLPHGHIRCEFNCTVCDVIETCRELLLGVLPFAAISALISSGCVIYGIRHRILPRRDHTPVGLKVKLSD